MPGRNNSGSNRGFANMDPERRREIASQGGKARGRSQSEGGSSRSQNSEGGSSRSR